jgi:PPK2 family polyphosphate:nucleotide phosphotransferase
MNETVYLLFTFGKHTGSGHPKSNKTKSMHKLSKIDTGPKPGIKKAFAEAETIRFKSELFDLQNVLFAEAKHSVLIILQGMDAAGKDGTIRHVFSSMNPMGVNIKAFKAPTEEELKHDFLWRVHPHTPARGMIEIFNRSHYEDLLVPTVHETLDKKTIRKREGFIQSFEENLIEAGTVILKFFLHISRSEQERRLKERTLIPRKKWKYDPADTREAGSWDAYMKAYNHVLTQESPGAQWHIVPADKKWYRNYVIAKKMVETLEGLKMKYPS